MASLARSFRGRRSVMRPKNRSRNSIPSDSFGMYTSITRRASSQPSSSPTRSTTGSLNRARGSSLRASIFIFSTACPIPSIPSSSYHGCVVSREAPGINLIGFVLCPVVPPAATRDPANQSALRIGSSVRFAPIITFPGYCTSSGPSDSNSIEGRECLTAHQKRPIVRRIIVHWVWLMRQSEVLHPVFDALQRDAICQIQSTSVRLGTKNGPG